MWIQRIDGALRGGRAGERALRKSRGTRTRTPFEVGGRERGLAEIDRAAKGLTVTHAARPRLRRTSASDGHDDIAGAGRVYGDVARRAVLGPVVHERPRKERCVHDTGPAAEHSGPLARDIPGKAHAGREVFVIGLPESRAYAWLALLNNSSRGIRIEVTQEVVDLSHRLIVFVAQAQIEHQSRLDAPVILSEPGVVHPFHRAFPVADGDRSEIGGSGEVVFEWSGSRERQSALKIDLNAPEVCCVLIGLNVRDLHAEFEGVRAPQIRDTVLKIEIRAGAGTHGTASI